VYLRKGARMQEWPRARRVNSGADTLALTESQPAEDPSPSVPSEKLVFASHGTKSMIRFNDPGTSNAVMR